MSSSSRPRLAHPTPGHSPNGSDRAAIGPPALSASVAGFDGAVIATISRHNEYVEGSGYTAVVGVVGDVDLDAAPLLHRTLVSAIDGNARVCCDLSEVRFFGASGADTMLAAHWHASAAGRRFSVRGVRGLTRRVFDITGLDRVLVVSA